MESLYLLVPLGLVVVFAAAVVFIRAADGGQFDDLAEQERCLPDED
ncbi:MAG TPA: cbb3-type cytochrome oxidase assembly protein CcoS [Nevskiaceae bacterium]|nr:cbb3-type cytochrome oxidase assembly protein CcoS [Nevskiaceae bacterium]